MANKAERYITEELLPYLAKQASSRISHGAYEAAWWLNEIASEIEANKGKWSSEAVSDTPPTIPRHAYEGIKFRDGTSSTDYMYKDKIVEPAKDELISPVTHSDIVEQINGKPQRYEPIESLDIRKILGKPLNTFENLTEDVLNLLIATVNQHSKQLGEM